jgi:serine/threonine-protein kinase HipA
MRKALIFVHGKKAGVLTEIEKGKYQFTYQSEYQGAPVSLAMPITKQHYEFTEFPPFFEGLLPEGIMLDALLRKCKIDKNDYFTQLLQVGKDTIGAVTIEEFK